MDQKIVDGIYYEDGEPKHRGVVIIDGEIYYAGHDGKLSTGHVIVHDTMSNGILDHGTYKFDEDGKLIAGSYHAPEKVKHKNRRDGEFDLFKVLCIVIISAAVIVGAIIGIAALTKNVGTNETEVPVVDEAWVELPTFDEDVYLCTKSMEHYYNGRMSFENAIESSYNPYAPLTFKYKISEGVNAKLELDGKEYELDRNKTSISIDNLYTGRIYQYKVTAEKDGEVKAFEGSLKTAETNRFILLPGASNTRDIGGYQTSYGKKIKQGLLIRGTEIDGLVENKYYLTDKQSAESFNFVYDFDLRSSDTFNGNYLSPLGKTVNHKFYTSPSYGAIFSNSNVEIIREIFSDLANPSYYPMYMHCTYGVDRTGTIVFLLQGILGVSEKDMVFEYSLSNKDISKLNVVINGLDGFEGNSINEKIENYLISIIGVTKDQIDSIRNIFLED